MELDLSGRHALVCGASAGIGRAVARELADLGADVTLLARTTGALQALVGQLRKRRKTQHHDFLHGDIANHAALHDDVAALVSQRPVHILINNTGGPPGGPAQNADPADYLDAFNKHLIGAHVVAQCVIPGMRKAGFGRIVNVISTSVKEPIRNLGVSNTVRGAVASWAKTLASELGPFGITVNNVLPGYTRTKRLEQIVADRVKATGRTPEEIEQAMLATVPAGRFADAGEIAAAIGFLCSPSAGYVNGINLPVDGGRTQSL